MIASDVTGKSFETLLQEIAIGRAELKDTYPGGMLDRSKNEATCYLKTGNGWNSRIVEHHEFMLPDGGFVSTPSDILKYIQTLLSGKIVSMESVNAILNFEPYNYGYGIQCFFYNETNPLYGHSGALYGYRSVAFYCPEKNFSIAVLLSGLDISPEQIAGVILASMLNPDFVIPKEL